MLLLSGTSWKESVVTWASFLEKHSTETSKLIFSSLGELRDVEAPLRQRVFETLQIPDFLESKPYAELNGFCGRQITAVDGKVLKGYGYWCRFVIKQTSKSLRPKPSFVRYDATMPPQTKHSRRSSIPLHGSRTLEYGWEWYEMLFAISWTAESGTTIVGFDIPQHLQMAIRSRLLQLTSDKSTSVFRDPFAGITVILDQIIFAYDKSVWAIRDHVCALESARQAEPNYALLHEISRHAIHVRETLEVASRSCKALIQQRDELVTFLNKDSLLDWTAISDRLQLISQVAQNLLSRSEANQARIQNEINLAFHVAAQGDNRTQQRMSEHIQEETVTMRNLSIIAVAFLPATFVSSIFGTAFFSFDAETRGNGFVVSDQFWIFWITAVPVSAIAMAIWWYYDIARRSRSVEGRC